MCVIECFVPTDVKHHHLNLNGNFCLKMILNEYFCILFIYIYIFISANEKKSRIIDKLNFHRLLWQLTEVLYKEVTT